VIYFAVYGSVWKKQCRDFAVREDNICVVTDPIFEDEPKYMGETDIPVPWGFYKVILDLTPPMKMIGFIVPNQA